MAKRRGDLLSDLKPYELARARLKPRLQKVQDLRDQGKSQEARVLLDKIEASRDFRIVKRFQQKYLP